MKKKIYRLSFDGQVNASLNNMFPYYIFEMKETVDAGKLQKAVVDSLKYHPTFKTRIIKKNFKYYLEENDRLPIVKEAAWDEPVDYGADDTNEYPWIITCSENKIVFTCAHAICDGMGAMHFLRDVLNCYFGLKVEELEAEKTIEDSFAINANKKAKAPFERKKPDLPVEMPLSMFETENSKVEYYRFVFQKEDIKEIAENTETSNFAMLSGMAAKALSRVLNAETGNIKVMVITDLRRQYNSVTDRGFVLTPELVYNIQKLKNKDVFLTATALRSQLDLFLDKDNVDFEVAKAQKNNDLLNICPFILRIAKQVFYNMLYSPRASIVYTHLVHMGLSPEIEEKIADFYVAGCKSAKPLIALLGANFKGKISLTFGECTKDSIYAKEFAKVLEEEGVSYKMENLKLHAPIHHKSERLYK